MVGPVRACQPPAGPCGQRQPVPDVLPQRTRPSSSASYYASWTDQTAAAGRLPGIRVALPWTSKDPTCSAPCQSASSSCGPSAAVSRTLAGISYRSPGASSNYTGGPTTYNAVLWRGDRQSGPCRTPNSQTEPRPYTGRVHRTDLAWTTGRWPERQLDPWGGAVTYCRRYYCSGLRQWLQRSGAGNSPLFSQVIDIRRSHTARYGYNAMTNTV